MSSPASGSLREKLVQKLTEALGGGDDAMARASRIESEINDRFAGGQYAAKGRSIVFNLGKNDTLRSRVMADEVDAVFLVTASVSDLAPESLKSQRQASLDRYVAQRSLSGDEQVVGWAAGTSGKLDWSHKYEKEKAAIGTGSVQVEDEAEEEDAAMEMDGGGEEGSEEGGKESGDEGGEEGGEGGEDDVAKGSSRLSGAKRGADKMSSSSRAGRAANTGAAAEYARSLVRRCSLPEAGASIILGPDKSVADERVLAALSTVREIVKAIESA